LREDQHPGVYIDEDRGPARVIEGVATFLAGVLLGVATVIAIERLRRSRCFSDGAPLAA
jgi:hypothetical protein